MTQQHANHYESATQPLRYSDNTLAQRGDVVLYLHEQDGRITNAQIMRVWDTIYYQDGSPIGVVLLDAESPKNALPKLHTFTVTDEFGNPQTYFRGELTVPQHKIPQQLCPLFRMGAYMKQWNDETKRINIVPQPPHEPYPDPDEIYDEFFQKTVLKQAKQGNPYCLFTAGLWQRNHFYPHRALEFFRAAARLNFSAAWLELGFAYSGSQLLERNPQKAAACFQQAANLNNALAHYELALFHINGKGVTQSDVIATEYLKTAIDGNILPAFLTLSLYYLQGTFNAVRPKNNPYRQLPLVEKKPRYAFKLLQQVSAIHWAGAAVSKYYLAQCYRLGEGVRPDPKRARELYQEAVKMGDIMLPEIQEACFYTGNVNRLAAAIENGSAYAAYLSGRMYLFGEQNTDKNPSLGRKHLRIAAESAHECADIAGRMLHHRKEEEISWILNQL